jgi:DNA helicase-2/ATP-dependent DNA helicase PcrA
MRRAYDQIRRNEPSRFLAHLPAACLAVRAGRRPPARPEMARRPEMAPRGAPSEPVYYLDDEGDDDPIFPRGAMVRHKVFGVGAIEEGSGRGPDRKLAIRFPGHGLKTIIARYVERVYQP